MCVALVRASRHRFESQSAQCAYNPMQWTLNVAHDEQMNFVFFNILFVLSVDIYIPFSHFYIFPFFHSDAWWLMAAVYLNVKVWSNKGHTNASNNNIWCDRESRIVIVNSWTETKQMPAKRVHTYKHHRNGWRQRPGERSADPHITHTHCERE